MLTMNGVALQRTMVDVLANGVARRLADQCPSHDITQAMEQASAHIERNIQTGTIEPALLADEAYRLLLADAGSPTRDTATRTAR